MTCFGVSSFTDDSDLFSVEVYVCQSDPDPNADADVVAVVDAVDDAFGNDKELSRV